MMEAVALMGLPTYRIDTVDVWRIIQAFKVILTDVVMSIEVDQNGGFHFSMEKMYPVSRDLYTSSRCGGSIGPLSERGDRSTYEIIMYQISFLT